MEIVNPQNGQRVWACAYRTTRSKESMALKERPVYGIIQNGYFYKLNKKEQIVVSSKINKHSRKYTNTKEECTELYNNMIEEQINFLRDLIYECEKDKIF